MDTSSDDKQQSDHEIQQYDDFNIGRRVRKMLTGLPEAMIERVHFDYQASQCMSNYLISIKVTSVLAALPDITRDSILTDAMCGIGGNTFAFMRYFRFVYAIDNDKSMLSMLANNVDALQSSLTDVGEVEMHLDDFINIMYHLQQDVIFYDPPWGLDYKKHNLMRIKIGDYPLEEVIAVPICKYVVLKLPYNYDFNYLFRTVRRTFAHVTTLRFHRPNTSNYVFLRRIAY